MSSQMYNLKKLHNGNPCYTNHCVQIMKQCTISRSAKNSNWVKQLGFKSDDLMHDLVNGINIACF